MKAIYKSTSARLQELVPELKWIDEDNGQLDQDHPPVSFPCCLLDISFPRCKSLTDTDQEVTVNIGASLAWDIKGTTASNAPEAVRDQGLSPYDLIDKVYKALQGWAPDGCQPLDRTSQKKATGKAAFVYGINFECLAED